MAETDAARPTWERIDLDRLSFNLRSSREFIGHDVACMAVVKANAYGHGAIQCAERLAADGVEWLAVATCEEGKELRDAGIATPILVLGGCWPAQESIFIQCGLTPAIFSIGQARRLNSAALERGVRLKVHVKIDTGMHRVGFDCADASAVSEKLVEMSGIAVDGLMTHFAAADDLAENEFTSDQVRSFNRAVEAFRSDGHPLTFVDAANSPGAVAHSEARMGLVRLGGILYGLGGDVLPAGVPAPELHPVLSLCSTIAQVRDVPKNDSIGYSRTFRTARDSRIATIPIGYHDGFQRVRSNRGTVIVRGVRCPLVGRVSMDWITVDVTGVPACTVGDTVTIIGSDGEEKITAEEIARESGTLSYEVTCGFDGRVRKEFASKEGLSR